MSNNMFSIRVFLPNLITVLAICAGLSALRFAMFGNFFNAIFLLMVAAFFDGLDGRVARAISGASAFGEQLDSLADAINFGVVPPIILYFYLLHHSPNLGWIVILAYTIACCLRLARFNSRIDSEQRQPWEKHYFIGVPAPMGALTLMLPVYIGEIAGGDLVFSKALINLTIVYSLVISFLLISRLPIANGKSLKGNFKIETLVFILLLTTVFISLLITFFWETLLVCVIAYFIFIPFSYLSWRKLVNKVAE